MWYFCDMKFTERSLSLCTSLPRGSVSFPEEASDLQRVLGLVRCFSFWGRLRLISYWQRCNELPDLSRFPPQDQARKKPVTPVLIGDQVEQTLAKTSGVFAANLVRPWLVGPFHAWSLSKFKLCDLYTFADTSWYSDVLFAASQVWNNASLVSWSHFVLALQLKAKNKCLC